MGFLKQMMFSSGWNILALELTRIPAASRRPFSANGFLEHRSSRFVSLYNLHLIQKQTKFSISDILLASQQGNGKVCIGAIIMACHQARAYLGFCGMKRLGTFLLATESRLPRRQALWKLSVLPKNTTQWPRPGIEARPLDSESSPLTTRPPRLHK